MSVYISSNAVSDTTKLLNGRVPALSDAGHEVRGTYWLKTGHILLP